MHVEMHACLMEHSVGGETGSLPGDTAGSSVLKAGVGEGEREEGRFCTVVMLYSLAGSLRG